MSYILPNNSLPAKVLYIDSRDANQYLATNSEGFDLTSYFSYILKEHIEVPRNQRALISLHSATIPYSFYNIRAGVNDSMPTSITIISGGIGTFTHTLTIPAGNYNVYSLATIITTQLPLLYDTEIDFSMEMLFDPEKQKFLWSIVGLGVQATQDIRLTIDFTATTEAEQNSLVNIETGWRYREIVIQYVGVPLSPNSLISPYSDNVVDINGSIHGVYIRTNLVTDSTLDSQNGTFSNILSRIPIGVQSGGLIFTSPSQQTHKTIVDLQYLNAITIRLTDERNRLIDLNGLHFQLAITIDFLYGEKRKTIREGGLSENIDGDSYAVNLSGGQISREAVMKAQLENQRQSEISELQKKNPKITESNPRGAGRPRKQGRPKK